MIRFALITLITILLILPIAGICAELENTAQPSVTAAPKTTPPPFPDVPEGHWAYDAVSNLKELGIVNGYSDGSFNGDKFVTRYELAVVLSRVIDALKVSLAPQSISAAPERKNVSKDAEEKVISRKSKQEVGGGGNATITDVARGIASTVREIVQNNVPHWEDEGIEDEGLNSRE